MQTLLRIDTVKMVPFNEAKANKDATWMAFEHTDGYNYPSIGIVRKFDLYSNKQVRIMLISTRTSRNWD